MTKPRSRHAPRSGSGPTTTLLRPLAAFVLANIQAVKKARKASTSTTPPRSANEARRGRPMLQPSPLDRRGWTSFYAKHVRRRSGGAPSVHQPEGDARVRACNLPHRRPHRLPCPGRSLFDVPPRTRFLNHRCTYRHHRRRRRSPATSRMPAACRNPRSLSSPIVNVCRTRFPVGAPCLLTETHQDGHASRFPQRATRRTPSGTPPFVWLRLQPQVADEGGRCSRTPTCCSKTCSC
jgi:hypothetical protein